FGGKRLRQAGVESVVLALQSHDLGFEITDTQSKTSVLAEEHGVGGPHVTEKRFGHSRFILRYVRGGNGRRGCRYRAADSQRSATVQYLTSEISGQTTVA